MSDPTTADNAASPGWPTGWALPLIASPQTTAPTRRALLDRLNAASAAPTFFDADANETFAAACARLVPSSGLDRAIDVAPSIDARLAKGTGDGWRYAALPPDGEAFRRGVAALDAAAEGAHAERFCDLAPADQDAILSDAQHARGVFADLDGFDARLWFADWLSECAGLFFGHPLAQQDIGYAGFADAPGWTQITLGAREEREPLPETP